jgi:hypothetical protein
MFVIYVFHADLNRWLEQSRHERLYDALDVVAGFPHGEVTWKINDYRCWGGLLLETRVEYGSAARRNRGRWAGQKCHRLLSEYVVGVIPGTDHRVGSYGYTFLKTGKEVLFACSPACGCTRGQLAGRPVAGKTAADVTCTKCGGR